MPRVPFTVSSYIPDCESRYLCRKVCKYGTATTPLLNIYLIILGQRSNFSSMVKQGLNPAIVHFFFISQKKLNFDVDFL